MSITVILDTGPLGLITSPKKSQETIAAAQWIFDMEAAGHRFLVPSIADYEVRRELIRAQTLEIGLPTSQFIVATSNVGHIARFVPAALWTDIKP